MLTISAFAVIFCLGLNKLEDKTKKVQKGGYEDEEYNCK